MKLTSEICFQAACNAGSVSPKTLENICAYAYNKMAQEEKEEKLNCNCIVRVKSPETEKRLSSNEGMDEITIETEER